MFPIFSRFFSKPKENNSEKVLKPEVINLLAEFRERLDSIEKDISKMRIILFELSNGKYNPFSETNVEDIVDKVSNKNKSHTSANNSNNSENNKHLTSSQNTDHIEDPKKLLSGESSAGITDDEVRLMSEILEKNQLHINEIRRRVDSPALAEGQPSDSASILNLENAEIALIQRFSKPKSSNMNNYLAHLEQMAWNDNKLRAIRLDDLDKARKLPFSVSTFSNDQRKRGFVE